MTMSTSQPVETTEPPGTTEAETLTPALSTGSHRLSGVLGVRGLFRYGIVWAAVVAVVAASLLSGSFLTTSNIQNVLTQNAALALVALGLTFVMIGGGFDLSSGPLVGACSVVAAVLANDTPTPVAVVVTIVVGALAGAVNGILVTAFRINAFVATLATGSVFTGLALLYTGSKSVFVTNSSFNNLGLSSVLGVRTIVVLVAALYLIGALVLAKSVFGRALYAVGGGEVSARLAGLRVNLTKALTFVIVGAAGGVGGVIFAALLTSGTPSTGSSITLDAITVVIIGGTSMFGGSGAVWRTAVGLVLVATVTNVYDLLAINSAWQLVTKGFLLVAAVGLDYLTSRKRA
jgi:ribose transport system permease protein